MPTLLKWLASLAITAAMVTISFEWLDRPIALMVHSGQPHSGSGILDQLLRIPDPLIPIASIAFVGLGLQAMLGRSFSNLHAAAFACSLSVLSAEAIKNQFKLFFGRTWPETWAKNNPSFIRDGVYGFHFMHGGVGYDSFPSGHMAATCAVISVVWVWFPRLKWLGAVAGLAVGAGLVGADYHFLSDVIAGAFLGVSTGWMACVIWTARTRSMVRNVE
jgi:membrane-associated phospholipid phosphatase